MKRCPRCGLALDASAFYRNRAQSDGFDGWCKDCRNGHARATNGAFKVRRQRAAANARYRLRHRMDHTWGTGDIE